MHTVDLGSYLVHNSHALSCSAALCDTSFDIDHGFFTSFTGNCVGDTATYTCDFGFELIGDATTTCTQLTAYNATFEPGPPVCQREYCMSDYKAA